jgi:large subunit ribosomal protein L17
MGKKVGRKNVRGKGGVRFKAGFTVSKKKAMLRNLVSELFLHNRLEVTLSVAEDLSILADKMITFAKKGDLASRRHAAKIVRNISLKEGEKTALQILFDEIGPKYAERNGGYTRILKTGNRRGDNAPLAIVELV